MNRDDMIARLTEKNITWDIIVIGGGATGLGIAVDAASRGYKVALLEKGDFGQGTSSRSTKLAHGGVRYLQQGNINLVLEALKERGILMRNAPHLVHDLMFVVPNYDWWEGPFYGIGLKLYDLMAGKEGLGRSKMISKEQTLEYIPTIETKDLAGGVVYYDGQFDDARLLINLARTAYEQSAVLVNYMPVVELHKNNSMIDGLKAVDKEKDQTYDLKARVVINATGPYSDRIRYMDDQTVSAIIQPSQGIHIVLDRKFLPTDRAIMVPHTADGRVLFAIPWYDHALIGTTDTPLDTVPDEPVPMKEEIEFVLEHARHYLSEDPSLEDVLSTFAGIRPLVVDPKATNTATLSRDHVIDISPAGLITTAGGKWTTYRKMAEETLEKAMFVGDLEPKACSTERLLLHGYHNHAENLGSLRCYGSDAVEIREWAESDPTLKKQLHPQMEPLAAEVVWAVRQEMARTVEDFLARRRRTLLLNARAAIAMAATVAELMGRELGRKKTWQKEQISAFKKRAINYLPDKE
ncbi:MAG: FAD-dependent oxidoreductase [Caldithrix sp.]|nr:FAD-dependent oxidoreductase [Caldithrix sp.]